MADGPKLHGSGGIEPDGFDSLWHSGLPARDAFHLNANPLELIRSYPKSQWQRLKGAPPKARAFTLRVTAKPEVRSELEQAFAYSHRSLFPDFPGHAEYGTSFR
jgi:hypothetical protein